MPTIEFLLERNAKIILASHLGRPKGQKKPEMVMAPVAARLRELFPDVEIVATEDCVGSEVQAAVDAMSPGSICLLENLRFHAEEEANDAEFSQQVGD